MIKGVFLALSACCVWGLIFAVPLFLEDISFIEIAIGRYFFFGMTSTLIVLCFKRELLLKTSKKNWITAFQFSLIANFIHYTALVIALQYTNAGLITLILGLAPITISLYSFRREKLHIKIPYLGFSAIVAGLILVNIQDFETNINFTGLTWGVIALATWTWYMTQNGIFLRNNPEITPIDWVLLLGVATLIMIFCATPFYYSLFPSSISTEELWKFLLGSSILGIISSLFGTYCWNYSLEFLPISIAGQLTIFETVFGLIFVLLIQQLIPSPLELLGMVLMILGVFKGFKAFQILTKYSIN